MEEQKMIRIKLAALWLSIVCILGCTASQLFAQGGAGQGTATIDFVNGTPKPGANKGEITVDVQWKDCKNIQFVDVHYWWNDPQDKKDKKFFTYNIGTTKESDTHSKTFDLTKQNKKPSGTEIWCITEAWYVDPILMQVIIIAGPKTSKKTKIP